MATMEKPKLKPVVMAERRNAASAASALRHRDDALDLTRALAEMREDRDRWRAQAERLAASFERLGGVEKNAVVRRPRAAQPDLTGDLLYGVPAIAAFLGIRTRQAEHRCSRGEIPTFRVGESICARRSTLTAWLADCESATGEGH